MKKKLAFLVAFAMIFAMIPAGTLFANDNNDNDDDYYLSEDSEDYLLDEDEDDLDAADDEVDAEELANYLVDLLAELEVLLTDLADELGITLEELQAELDAAIDEELAEFGLTIYELDLEELTALLEGMIEGLTEADYAVEDLDDLYDWVADYAVDELDDLDDLDDVNDLVEPIAIDLPVETVIRLTIGEVIFTINGVPQEALDAAPFIDVAANRTMVPLRAVSEGLGATVAWDGDTNTVTIVGATTLEVVVGEELAEDMGAAVIVDARTFVPVRFVAESLGATVVWERETETVVISQ